MSRGGKKMDLMNCSLIFWQRFLLPPHLAHPYPFLIPQFLHHCSNLQAPCWTSSHVTPLTNLLLLSRSHTAWRTVYPSKFTSTLTWGSYSLGQSRCTLITTWVSSCPRAWGPRYLGIRSLGVPGMQELRVWGSGESRS